MTKIDYFEQISLKDSLEEKGFLLPCGGKGICGKCRIVAPMLQPTTLDKRFLNADEISNGIRIACDKKTFDGLQIDCNLSHSSGKISIENPQIIAIIRKNHVDIGILDNYLISLSSYPITSKSTLSLRAVIGKNAIEFYERFGIAKASEILVIASHDDILTFSKGNIREDCLTYGDYYDAALFSMPSELVYLPPMADKALGSLFLTTLLPLEDGSVMVDIENSLIAYKSPNNLVAAPLFVGLGLIEDMNDGLYSTEVKAFLASIRYFYYTFKPKACYLLQTPQLQLKAVNQVLRPYNIKFNPIDDLTVQTAIQIITEPKVRTKLEKLARVTVYLDKVAQNDVWQKLFSE